MLLLAAVLFGRSVGLLAAAAATALAVWLFVAAVGGLRVEDPRDAWAALAFAATGRDVADEGGSGDLRWPNTTTTATALSRRPGTLEGNSR